MEFKEVSGKATAIGIAEMLPWWRSLAGLFDCNRVLQQT